MLDSRTERCRKLYNTAGQRDAANIDKKHCYTVGLKNTVNIASKQD